MTAVAELEHFIGYGGRHLNTVHYHPLKAETLIYSAAAVLIIEDVNDPHKQEFLRGHDAEISAVDVSMNGKLVASGQLGSVGRKGAVAPVIIWDFDNRQKFIEFNGIAQSVLCVRFSPDGRFVVATGANQMIFVWDVSTGEAVYSRRTESPCHLGAWGPITEGGRYPSYILCTTYDNNVFVHDMAFDVGSMCYQLQTGAVQFPSSGLQRKHLCGLVRGDFLITGTSAGDMCVFSLKSKVFRTALPVCNNGVSCIAQSGDVLYVAGGDGRVKAVRGNDAHWDVLAENVLEVGIVAMTPSSDGAELVIGTRNGKLWRLLTQDLTATLQAISHTGEVTDCTFGVQSDHMCSVSDTGEVFVIDLSDYMPIMSVKHTSPIRSAVVSSSHGEIVVGHDDGFLRCWQMQRGKVSSSAGTQQLWQMHAHRGGVSVVRETADYIVTGGNDAAVRFWHRSTRELLATFHNHKKAISDLVVDNVAPHIVHSGAEDRLICTYDLKQNKALIQHQTTSSNVTGLSQRKDREHEVVSVSLDGKVLFWDVDYADPVGALESPGGQVLRFRCCEVSPSGRYIAAGTDDTRLYIYDLMTCQCIQESEAHSQAILSVKWSPDQKQIITCGRDGCIVVWNFFEV